MLYIVIGLLIVLVIVLFCFLVALINVTKNQEKTITREIVGPLPYSKRLLLTKNEWTFYKRIKPIAD